MSKRDPARPTRRNLARPSSSLRGSSGAGGVPRVVKLLGVLVLLILVALPIYLWRLTSAATTEPTSPSVANANANMGAGAPAPQLPTLPTEAEYPPVDQMRAEAEQLAERLVERFPDSPGALHIVANQAAQLHQYEQAEDLWQRTIAIAPHLAGPQAGLAQVQMEQGNDAEAVRILEDALNAGMATAEIYQTLCQAAQNTGDSERALEACREGLSRFPHDGALWFELGQLQLQLGQLEEAREALRRAAAIHPNLASIYNSLSTVMARLGEEDQAGEYRERYLQLREEDPVADIQFEDLYRASMQRVLVGSLVNAASEYRVQGDLEAAEQHWRRALELHPRSEDALRALVSLYRQQQRLSAAAMAQERLVEAAPTAQNFVNLASLAMTVGRPRQAEAALRAALRDNPRSIEAHRSLILLYQHQNQWDRARDTARELTQIAPTSEHFQWLADICLRMQDHAGHRAAVERAEQLAGSPSSP